MRAILIALCAILGVSFGRVIDAGTEKTHLLGSEECTWGPSYWCENFKTSKRCNSTTHCIKTWEEMTVPEDNDNVCDICKDMVQQARDQLRSNETQMDLKAVFEGSCKLIYIKPIIHECINLVDEFIPELVESLASQMNPSVVCTVAGLCNSAHIDKLLVEHKQMKRNGAPISMEGDILEPDECSKCYTIATHMEHKLQDTKPDQLLKRFLYMCREFGSFSDACAATTLTHFNAIYAHLKENFNAENICHLSGQCSAQFHQHEGEPGKTLKVDIRPLSSVGMVDVGDDLPCKLCEQLVQHLKDLLVANTTEAEFRQVLEGLCKQTKSFATECKAIVDEYYMQMYDYLTKGLDGNFICQMSGICPGPGNAMNRPIMPLIPEKQAKVGLEIMKNREHRNTNKDQKNLEAAEMQLPIERLMPFSQLQASPNVNGKQGCAMCEYVLHYIQEIITNPNTEETIKHALNSVCTKMPQSLKGECNEFVKTYGDAFVAILAQEIDPSLVCPTIHLCPSKELMEMWESVPEHMIQVEPKSKPSCPLCLLAVQQLYDVIKNNKTEANIEAELDKLCNHLPKSLVEECTSLVQGYSKELVEMLLADLSPQEICVYIKLCDSSQDFIPKHLLIEPSTDIMTNEIPDYSPHPAQNKQVTTNVGCVLCEFVMERIDGAMGNEKNRNKIEHLVRDVCEALPKTVRKQCYDFIDQYADVVIEILSKDVSPKQVCSMIGLCAVDMKKLEASIAECALCQMVISTLDKILKNPKVESDIEKAVFTVCDYVPASKHDKCESMIEVYGPSIINIITEHADSRKVCSAIALCSSDDYVAMSITGSRAKQLRIANGEVGSCSQGPTYWCSKLNRAEQCKAVDYCRKNVWIDKDTSIIKKASVN
ncbi:hypothetical protein KM043_002376 [Ampulex compressa]|uniref:Prosaposin-like protein n=1 Tax=Ampulex compressa TaxID=860918 RepID=A0A1W6EW39_AMPCP|nr:prosaposin-like protein [Ampulex compressa]KAG7213045.1 hypothetical protein KM043_002376 [Ampulex compressa]